MPWKHLTVSQFACKGSISKQQSSNWTKVLEGRDASLICVFNGDPHPSVEWKKLKEEESLKLEKITEKNFVVTESEMDYNADEDNLNIYEGEKANKENANEVKNKKISQKILNGEQKFYQNEQASLIMKQNKINRTPRQQQTEMTRLISKLTIKKAKKEQEGFYACKVSNQLGEDQLLVKLVVLTSDIHTTMKPKVKERKINITELMRMRKHRKFLKNNPIISYKKPKQKFDFNYQEFHKKKWISVSIIFFTVLIVLILISSFVLLKKMPRKVDKQRKCTSLKSKNFSSSEEYETTKKLLKNQLRKTDTKTNKTNKISENNSVPKISFYNRRNFKEVDNCENNKKMSIVWYLFNEKFFKKNKKKRKNDDEYFVKSRNSFKNDNFDNNHIFNKKEFGSNFYENFLNLETNRSNQICESSNFECSFNLIESNKYNKNFGKNFLEKDIIQYNDGDSNLKKNKNDFKENTNQNLLSLINGINLTLSSQNNSSGTSSFSKDDENNNKYPNHKPFGATKSLDGYSSIEKDHLVNPFFVTNFGTWSATKTNNLFYDSHLKQKNFASCDCVPSYNNIIFNSMENKTTFRYKHQKDGSFDKYHSRSNDCLVEFFVSNAIGPAPPD